MERITNTLIEKTSEEISSIPEYWSASGKVIQSILDVIKIGALPALIVFFILAIIFNRYNKRK